MADFSYSAGELEDAARRLRSLAAERPQISATAVEPDSHEVSIDAAVNSAYRAVTAAGDALAQTLQQYDQVESEAAELIRSRLGNL